MPRTKKQFKELRDRKREIILRAALRQFAEKGYENTSINDIAKTAHISNGLTYHYFKSKQELLQSIVKKFLSIADELFEKINSVEDPSQQLRIYIESLCGLLDTQEESLRLFLLLSVQPGIIGKLREVTMTSQKKYLDIMERIFTSLGFDQPKLEARFLDVFVDGVMLNYLSSPADFPLKEMIKFLLERYSGTNSRALALNDQTHNGL